MMQLIIFGVIILLLVVLFCVCAITLYLSLHWYKHYRKRKRDTDTANNAKTTKETTLRTSNIAATIDEPLLAAKRRKYRSLPTFTMDPANFTFDEKTSPYDTSTSTVVNSEIENTIDCNVNSLHRCRIDDATTVFGCKELAVRCHHFDEDTVFKENGKERIIPRNSEPREGYALAIPILTEACNPYHGELVLVTLSEEARNYMLLCSCKHPGLVGNNTLLGACETVRICPGRGVVDINTPLDQMQCKCAAYEEQEYVNLSDEQKFPICREMTIDEANRKYDDWSHLLTWPPEKKRISTTRLERNIRSNLRCKEVMSMCHYAADEPDVEIEGAELISQSNQCQLKNYGIPAKLQVMSPPKDPPFRPNILGWQYTENDCVISSGRWRAIRFTDQVGGRRRIVALHLPNLPQANLPETDVMVVAPKGITIGLTGQLAMTSRRNEMYAPQCDGAWPHYTCEIRNAYETQVVGLSTAKHRPVPASFIWNREQWDQSEYLVGHGLTFNFDGPLLSSLPFFTPPDNGQRLWPYGLMWVNVSESDADDDVQLKQGLVTFKSKKMYDKFIRTVTI